MSGDSRATACRKTSVTCLVLRRLQHIVESDLGRSGHRCEAIHVELFVQVETEQLWRILKRDRNLQRIIQTGHAFVDDHIGKNVWLKRRHNQRDCFRADTPGFQTYLLCAGTFSKPLSNLDELSRLNSNCTLNSSSLLTGFEKERTNTRTNYNHSCIHHAFRSLTQKKN